MWMDAEAHLILILFCAQTSLGLQLPHELLAFLFVGAGLAFNLTLQTTHLLESIYVCFNVCQRVGQVSFVEHIIVLPCHLVEQINTAN